MAVIPDAPSLGRRAIPQSSRGMVSVDLSTGAEGMIRTGQQISQVGEVLNKQVEQEQRDKDEMEAAQATLALKEFVINNYDEQKQNPDDYQNFEKNFKTGYELTKQKAASLFSNPRMAERFNTIVAPEIELNAVSRLRDLGQGVYTEKQKVYISNGIDVAQRSLMQDSSDQNYMANALTLQKVIDGSSLSPIEKQNLNNSARKTLTEAKLSAMSPQEIFDFSAKEVNPVNVVMRNEIGPSAQIRVHSDGDGKAIGGINSVAFPKEFNEASRILNEQGQDAARNYISGFYDKMARDRGIDKLPAGIQDVVLDGVVNHRGGFQSELIEAAKGGVTRQELIDMRRAEYKRLVDTGQEKYTKNAAGWENRLKSLERGMYDTDVLIQTKQKLPKIAEDAFFNEVAQNPQDAIDSLNSGKYDKFFDQAQKKKNLDLALSAIQKQNEDAKNMRFAQQAKKYSDVYNSVINNAPDARQKIFELRESSDSPDAIEFADNMFKAINKANPLSPEEALNIAASNVAEYDVLAQKIEDAGGDIGFNAGPDVGEVLQFRKKLMIDSARGVPGLNKLINKLTVKAVQLTGIEEGYDDAGWKVLGERSETYDAGYELISRHVANLDSIPEDKKIITKMQMFDSFVDQADALPPEIKANKASLDDAIRGIARNVIKKPAIKRTPDLMLLDGVPSGVVKTTGAVEMLGVTDKTLTPTSKISDVETKIATDPNGNRARIFYKEGKMIRAQILNKDGTVASERIF